MPIRWSDWARDILPGIVAEAAELLRQKEERGEMAPYGWPAWYGDQDSMTVTKEGRNMAAKDPTIPMTNQVAPKSEDWVGPISGLNITPQVYRDILAAYGDGGIGGIQAGDLVAYRNRDYRRQTIEVPEQDYRDLLALLRDKEARIGALEGELREGLSRKSEGHDRHVERLTREHERNIAAITDECRIASRFGARARVALELAAPIVLGLFNETSDNELFSRCKRALAKIDDCFAGTDGPQGEGDDLAPVVDQAVPDGRDCAADGPARAPGSKLDCQGEGTDRAASRPSYAHVIAVGNIRFGDPVTVVEHPRTGHRYAFRFDGASEYRVDGKVCKPIYRTLWGKDNINNIWPVADQGHAKIGACEATWGTIRDTYPTSERWVSDLMKGSSEPPLGDARPKVEYHYMGQLGAATFKVEGEVYDDYPEHVPETWDKRAAEILNAPFDNETKKWVKPVVEVVPLPAALAQKELSAEDLQQLCRAPLRYIIVGGRRMYDYKPAHIQEMKYLGLDVNKEVDRKKYVAITPSMPDFVSEKPQ